MSRARTALRVGLVVVASLGALTGGMYWYRMVWLPSQPLLPDFVELPPGDRAPSTALLGFVAGKTTLTEAQTLLQAKGIACEDTSIRALMGKRREAVKAQIDEAKAKGQPIDGITGASLVNYKSKKERNPQVRLSCEDVAASTLDDRPRADATGRLLLIFDAPDLPLRHASFHRKFQDEAQALQDFEAAKAALRAVHGAPHSEGKALDAAAQPVFANFSLHKVAYAYADARVEVTAMRFGKRGVDVGEEVEVPWPVRPDAPALPPDTPRGPPLRASKMPALADARDVPEQAQASDPD